MHQARTPCGAAGTTLAVSHRGRIPMLQPGTSRVTKAPLFPLRSIVTLIMAHEGPGLICCEFAFALGLYSALGLFLVFQQGGRSPTALILGMLFLGIALNYVPLLIYALSLWRSK